MTKIADYLLDMVFPRHCPVCDEVLPFGGKLICDDCERKTVFVREPRCRKCGKSLASERGEYCSDCSGVNHSFDRAVSAFVYNDALKDAVFRFKYGGRQEYAYFFADSIYRYLGREIRSFGAEALIPVPIHKNRLKKRGFNQAELIAERLGILMGLPVEKNLIKRIADTRPQKGLSREERRKNLKRAFKLTGNDVKLCRVIIIDDIYTTGSTVDEMAELLKKAGVSSVYVVTLCSGSAL